MSTPRTAFTSGVRSILPIIVGVVPFALITGAATVNVGIPTEAAISMSFLVFAGTARLAAIDLIAQNAPTIVIIATAWIINLRFMMYSAALAPHFKRLAPRWKLASAYLLTDQAFAVSIAHFSEEQDTAHKAWFFFGGALPMWAIWQVSTAAGALLGTQVPESWSLDFAIPLTFLALLVPAIQDRATSASALAAGVAAIVAFALPFNLGLIVAVLIGIITGFIVEWRMA